MRRLNTVKPSKIGCFVRNSAPFVVCIFLFSSISGSDGLTAEDLSDKDQRQLEDLIHDYIMQNPEVILRSIQQYRENEEQAQQDRTRQTLANLSPAIANDPATPIGGNPDGTITVIEFFDYQCGYCKRVLPAIQELVATDDRIRLVFKEFPILGEQSVVAARASLAVWNTWPEHYVAFHDSLMAHRGSLSESRIMDTAKHMGLDTTELVTAMQNDAIDIAIQDNYALAETLGINGTPAFIFGTELIPGAIDLETMRELADRAAQG